MRPQAEKKNQSTNEKNMDEAETESVTKDSRAEIFDQNMIFSPFFPSKTHFYSPFTG